MSGPPTPRTPVEPALAWPPELLLRAQGVRVAIFDVDGVLTDGGLYFGPEGEAQIANTRIHQHILIVDRLFDATELRLGSGDRQQTVRIVRTDGRPSS